MLKGSGSEMCGLKSERESRLFVLAQVRMVRDFL